MSDIGLETLTATPGSKWRRRSGWLIVLAFLSLALIARFWKSVPDRDPRLVGEWQTDKGMVRLLHADGRVDELDSSGRPVFTFGPRVWCTESNVLVIGGRPSPVHQSVRTWFQNLISPVTGVGFVRLSGPRYEVVEVTETTLALRRIRPPGAPQVPVEVYCRRVNANQ
jgi:hypothetical protein